VLLGDRALVARDHANCEAASELENEVKPFVTDMAFRGQKTLLDEARQLSLARWCVKTAMVNEFTSAAAEHKYFTGAERLAFKDSFAIPENLWIWLARYDGVLPLHSLQIRAPKTADKPPTLYSLTFGSNFFVLQIFGCREDHFAKSLRPPKGRGFCSCIQRGVLGSHGPPRPPSMTTHSKCSTTVSREWLVGLSNHRDHFQGADARRRWPSGRSVVARRLY
jgi:hypothetical protein